jgi:exodeoxyribonuclease V gamma subunit
VRARFGFTDDDLDAITDWVRKSGIRWGFDQQSREPFGLDDFMQNTWRFGLDRILAGVTMSEDSHAWIGRTLPLDDVSSEQAELVGGFAEFVRRLTGVVSALTGKRPLAEWLDTLGDGVALLARASDGHEWQSAHMQHEFADVLMAAGTCADTPMRLSDVRALLDRHLAGRPTRANFRTGTLTVCTMVPMRSVPHRVVCLVGLDDGVFPRIGVVDGDDVLARNPMTGERDIRSEDRQLLLDAICAATEKLVVTYTGADVLTGEPHPPAVPLAELLDALDATTSQQVHDRVVVRQPLQPFSIRNVTPGELGVPTPFTFDQIALVAAKAAAGERHPRPDFVGEPLPEQPCSDVALADLLAFFRDPVKGYFDALNYTLPSEVEAVQDAMPVQLTTLEAWAVGDRMLGDLLRGMGPEWAREAEWRRGTLPPGQLGWREATEISQVAADIASLAGRYRDRFAEAHDVDIDLGGGRRLTGTVSDVYGDRIVLVTYSKLSGKQLIEAWLKLLALSAAQPGRDVIAVYVGRSDDGSGAARLLGQPQGPPLAVLRDLVALYDAGRREPLPLPARTSFAWATARHAGTNPLSKAAAEWNSHPGRSRENEKPAPVKAWGHRAPLGALLVSPRPGEEVAGEETRLGAFAARLWLPLLRAERKPPR